MQINNSFDRSIEALQKDSGKLLPEGLAGSMRLVMDTLDMAQKAALLLFKQPTPEIVISIYDRFIDAHRHGLLQKRPG